MYNAAVADPDAKFGGLTEFVFGVLIELGAEDHSVSLAEVRALHNTACGVAFKITY